MSPELTFLGSAVIAMIGWGYTARKQRSLSRKQHTFNALLATSFNKDYQDNIKIVRLYIDGIKGPLKAVDDLPDEHKDSVRFILNHYEFIAAGIRNGDIDELLLRDSERGTVVRIFETFETYLYGVRNRRGRDAIFEHLEWLYRRWKTPPGAFARGMEWCRGKPFYGSKRAHD